MFFLVRAFISRDLMGNIQNPFILFYPPFKTTSLTFLITHHLLVNSTRYPASQNFFVDTSDCSKAGTMCASITSSGNLGMFMLHVCVERAITPLCKLIVMGCFANFLFFTGAVVVRKLPVAPVSEIPWSLSSEVFSGGVACACCVLVLCFMCYVLCDEFLNV